MISIAVLVSGGGTNLQALINAENAGKISHGKISLVLASNDKAYALERAKKADIPAIAVKRKDYASQEDFDQALIASMHAYKIDMIILAGYLSILGASVIDAYRDRMINIHPSLIPSFCGKGFYGLHVHEAALARGVKVTGATVHYVNEIPDGGKIILQKAVEIQEDDTPEILQKRVMEQAEWILLPKAAEMVAEKIAEEKAK
ncbi:MAG: phosphoribosylglycinamide formyltransferase [Erysipelotrichaceae bacterium]|nr:phosphoribosylglycinamide formyltransferase [Erysipelotrichaceae bacterium]